MNKPASAYIWYSAAFNYLWTTVWILTFLMFYRIHDTAVSYTHLDVYKRQAGQRVDFPVPVGASDGCVFQNPLYGFKICLLYTSRCV